MKAPRINRSLMTLLAAWLLCVPSSHGQLTGQVSGMVVDPTGGVIAGASVTLFSDEFVRTAIADQYGRFDFQNLPDVPTNLEVSSLGFKTVTMTNIRPGERGLFEVILEPGSCPQCVTVVDLGGCHSIRPMVPIVPSRVFYEERLGNASVVGSVRDVLAGALSQVTVTLVNSAAGSASVTTTTNDKGEFQFTNVEPGRYVLKATRDKYSQASAAFFVARETLTRIDRISLYLESLTKYGTICAPDIELESSPLPKELIPPR